MKPKPTRSAKHNRLALLNTAILSAYFYVFMEWLFFVTKPSSVSSLPWFEEVKLLILAGGAVALFPLAGVFCFLLPALIIHQTDWRERIIKAGYIFPAFLLSVTALIMVDNFTYTVFKFGVRSSEGLIRIGYAIGFIGVFLRFLVSLPRNTWIHKQPGSRLILSLITASTIGFTAIYFSNDPNLRNPYTGSSTGDYPNIIVLGADGLSAKYLSAYGYSLNTTPFLSELKESSLFAENAFPNAASTTASTASLLTGKEPTEVQVFRYPDILSGRDSFEHLPGILKRHGYLTVEIGAPYYVDAGKLNLLDGFDISYNQSLDLSGLDVLLPILGNSQSMYFFRSIVERADERLQYIFLNRKMEDPVTSVYDPKARISDTERVDLILNTLDNADRPVFIFTHMMDTHGPEFASEQYVFSTGPSSKKWDVNNYLDAILTFDGNVQKIYNHLAQTGKLDDTILVIYTDHGFTYTINERIPIVIRFPHNEYSRSVQNNVQVIDIPVTLLDYLNIPQPDWMSGASLLRGEPPADRILYATTSGTPEKIAPPFFQINILQGIVCDRWYQLDVRKKVFRAGRIANSSTACLPPDDEELHQTLLEYLEHHGYDVRSLR